MTTNAVPGVVAVVTFLDYWHAGSGSGGGLALDALVDKDVHGLPRVGGRMLKGLLREAVYRAERWGAVSAGATETLFGSDGFVPVDTGPAVAAGGGVREKDPEPRMVPRDLTMRGALRVSDARLPKGERQALEDRGARHLHPFFFRELFATAIASDDTAKTGTLRGIEVTVPVVLEAAVTWTGEAGSPFAASWPDILRRCAPLVRSIGAHRSRGLGRASLSIRALPSSAEALPATTSEAD